MTQPAEHRVTIVTVCYNSAAILTDMLKTIPDGAALVVVDNGSKDTAQLEDLSEINGFRLILNRENVGFGAACNIGASAATTEFLLFLNPDAALAADTIGQLVNAADTYPDAAAFNPRIEEAGGAQFFKRKSQLIPRTQWLARGWPDGNRSVPILSGAAFFVRRDAFNAVGGFDPAIFLYHEDDDLSLRLRKTCGPLMFVRDAVVRHVAGHSTVRRPETAALKAWYMGQSRVYACRKHGRPFAFGRALLEACLQLLSPVTWLSARKRAKHIAFLRAVLASRTADTATMPPGPLSPV